MRRDRAGCYAWPRRSVLVFLLVKQIFLFRPDELAATAGFFVDLAVLGVVAAELKVLTER